MCILYVYIYLVCKYNKVVHNIRSKKCILNSHSSCTICFTANTAGHLNRFSGKLEGAWWFLNESLHISTYTVYGILWTLYSYLLLNNYLSERLNPIGTYRHASISGLVCNSVIQCRSSSCVIFWCIFTVGSLRDWLKWSYIYAPYSYIRQPWRTHKYNII